MANNSLNTNTVPIPPASGGTGVANTGTITVGGNTSLSGAFTFAGTITGNTAVTFPTSGTLQTTAGSSGVVSSGTANQLGYYAGTGTTISGLTSGNNSILVTDGSGAPSISGTLPFTVPVTTGGTGVSTMTTPYAPVISGTTATGPLQVASTGLATAGNILTSNGSSSIPSFQAPAFKTIAVTMTAAQWNGMNATPFQLVAAPGAGFCHIVFSFNIFINFVAQFTGGGAVVLQWGTTAAGAGSSMMNTMPGTNFTGIVSSMSQQTTIAKSATAKATFDNLSLCLSNQGAAFANGVGSTLNVVVTYMTVATGL